MDHGTTQLATRRSGIPLGRPLGIPVFLSPSWFFVGLLVTLTAAQEAALTQRAAAVDPRHYVIGFAVALVLAGSVLAHELGHSVISLILGLRIRRITLFLLGGLVEIEKEPESADREYLVAVAGPLVSLLLAGLMFAGAVALPDRSALSIVLASSGFTNALLALFNLLPGLPLDGGRVLRAAVWHLSGDQLRGTRVAVRAGQTLAVLLGLAGVAQVMSGAPGGFFLVLIAVFIYSSGAQTLRRGELVSRVPALSARQLVRPCLSVPAELPLAEALRRANDVRRRLLVVDAYGRPEAVISAAAVNAVPSQRRPWVAVGTVARRLGPGLVLSADLEGHELIEALRATPASEYLVVEPDGGVVGVLAAVDVAGAVEGRAASAAPA